MPYLPSKKKKKRKEKKQPRTKYAKSKYHQSLLHVGLPGAMRVSSGGAISRFHSWNSLHDK